MDPPITQIPNTPEHFRKFDAYRVEENLRCLILAARAYPLGDPERGLDRLSKITMLSLAFPSTLLRKLDLFDLKPASVQQEYSFVDVNSKLDYVFKPMRQVILKIACSVNCHHFRPNCRGVPGLFQRYDQLHNFLFLKAIVVRNMKDIVFNPNDFQNLEGNNFQVRD